jgi:indole-3-glycerol phosphate synthase
VDIDRSISLAGKLPATLPKIAESGIDDPETVVRMRQAGFSGFLMGEHFMKHADPGEAFHRFVEKVSTLSGVPQRM